MPIQIDLGPSSSSPKAARAQGPVIGIDLGTTNSLVAYAGDSKARVLLDERERSMLPSVVYLDETGEIKLVGFDAVELKSSQSRNVLFSVKRLMGRSLKDLQNEREQIPFELVDDELHRQVRMKVGTRVISPVEVSAEILRRLKTRAEKALNQTVSRAVVTVPAYFDDAQRGATRAAAKLAGLEVLRIVNEPTAAALAYGWSNQHPGTVAVYDLGGGTFDVSILRIEENTFQVLATAGDTHLGGDDFDQILVDFFLQKLQSEFVPDEWKSLDHRQIRAELRVLAEDAKIQLSALEDLSFRWRGHFLHIDRSEAEELWRPLVERTLEACRQTLLDARLTPQHIDDVLLVGGSTRVPLVQKVVGEFFAKTPNISLNPDEAVALGAALQAQILAGNGEQRLLLDVVPLSLGLETMGGAVSKLILRNSTLPTEAVEIFTNHSPQQTAFDVHILQGERELAKDNRSLARFKLSGFQPAPAGFHRIEVLFRIDANGILNVRAKDLRSLSAQEIEVRPSFGISDDELTQMLEAAETHAESDMQARQLVDLRIEADTVIRAAELAIKNVGHRVSSQELGEFQARLVDLKNCFKGSSIEDLRRALDEIESAGKEIAELQVNAALQSALADKDVDKV